MGGHHGSAGGVFACSAPWRGGDRTNALAVVAVAEPQSAKRCDRTLGVCRRHRDLRRRPRRLLLPTALPVAMEVVVAAMTWAAP